MPETLQFAAGESPGTVSALLECPADARALYVLAHGAGAGMHHPFMTVIATALAQRSIATFRYQFPYTEAGRRRPDPTQVLTSTVRAAVAAAAAATDLPLIAGGKSMGGRMTSLAQAERALPNARRLAFIGFPLHLPKRDNVTRAAHLPAIAIPMLFVQGTRDRLARLDLITGVTDELGSRTHLHVVATADHGFHVLKRSGRTDADALAEIADAIAAFCQRVS